MKTLHVARRFTPAAWGGTESVVASLVRAQRARGNDATVLCTAALDRPGHDTVLGAPVERFRYTYGRALLSPPAREALDRKGGNPLSAGLLLQLLREPGVGIFHCHTMQRLAGQVRWAARRRGVPYVLHLHGGEFDVPAAEVREMLAPTSRTLDWGKVPSALLGTRRALAEADLVLVLSRDELERARERLPGTRVERLPNGVDPSWLGAGDRLRGRRRLGLDASSPLALTVARVDPQKGQELIPAVLAEVPSLHAVLAGPVTVPGYDRKVFDRARSLGVEGRLHLLGGVAPESAELADLFAAANLFLLPSRHEPFGIVALEAWAAGLPLIACAAGGLKDLVRDGEDGFLVPVGEAEPLAASVARVVSDPLLARRLGEEGRVRVTRDFAWSAVAGRLAELYADIGREP